MFEGRADSVEAACSEAIFARAFGFGREQRLHALADADRVLTGAFLPQSTCRGTTEGRARVALHGTDAALADLCLRPSVIAVPATMQRALDRAAVVLAARFACRVACHRAGIPALVPTEQLILVGADGDAADDCSQFRRTERGRTGGQLERDPADKEQRQTEGHQHPVKIASHEVALSSLDLVDVQIVIR